MAKYINNVADLEKLLLKQCEELCKFASEKLYEAIDFFIRQYYDEWTPRVYQRTKAFLKSAFKTEVKRINNGYEAVVGINYESLNQYKDATGLEVVTWANEGLHGGIDVGTDTHVWDDAMDITINNGQLLRDCIEFLRKKGFTVIV